MIKFAANIDWLFTELPFLGRFQAASEAGFRGVEFLFPYGYPAQVILELLERNRLEVVLFNVYAGDWQAGERGFAAYPDRLEDFAQAAGQALEYARILRVRRLHVLAGLDRPEFTTALLRETYIENLRDFSRKAAPFGVTLLVEGINQVDMPGYFVKTAEQAAAICKQVGEPNVRLQLDFYHCQMSEGALASKISAWKDLYAHVQIAGIPGRNEPCDGEVNYSYLLRVLEDMNYGGWVGLEYRPAENTQKSLVLLHQWAHESGLIKQATIGGERSWTS